MNHNVFNIPNLNPKSIVSDVLIVIDDFSSIMNNQTEKVILSQL